MMAHIGDGESDDHEDHTFDEAFWQSFGFPSIK
jgi:hypothetical protein